MPRSYHHGNLHKSLIEEGVKLIEEKGVNGLTLREIGARAGVSRTAAYRHFSDKAELLEAISETAFTEFGDALEAARDSVIGSAAKRLDAMGLAYVRFAVEHRAYYKVMFGIACDAEDRGPRESAAGARAFRILADTIRDGQKAGEFRAGDPALFAKVIWTMSHGIATLELGSELMIQASEILRTGIGAIQH